MRMVSSGRLVFLAAVAFFLVGGGTALASYVVSSNSDIGPGTVSGHNPPPGDHANVIQASLNATDLASGAVTGSKLASDSVTSAKVLDASLAARDLALPVRLPTMCTATQIARWSGSSWVCSSDATGADWSLTGDSGATAGTNFLGTTDDQPLIIKVNKKRALRLEPTSGTPNLIGGFSGNSVTAGAEGATIAGGGDAGPGDQNEVSASYATIGEGNANTVGGTGSTVGGGHLNTTSQDHSVIAGGDTNTASGINSTIGGGYFNSAAGNDSTVAGGVLGNASGMRASVGGGYGNSAGDYATVGGGQVNTANAFTSTVAGGNSNAATAAGATVPGGGFNRASGNLSLAAGWMAHATHLGSFVWGDATGSQANGGTNDSADNEFIVRASGGTTFYSSAAGTTNAGVSLAPGMGSWSSLSDRHAKVAVDAVSGRSVLSELRRLPIETWRYSAERRGVRHLGPMAQAFYRRFGLGQSRRYIADVDAQGVALAAIKGLASKVRAQRRLLVSEQRNNRLQDERIAALRRAVNRLRSVR